MTKRYIGIDPGQGGGIAVLRGGSVELVARMPETERDIYELLLGASAEAHACIEKVGASPQMGTVSAFTFGKGLGALRMALVAACIPFDEVLPKKWQAFLGCASQHKAFGERDSTKAKNATKRRAQELFPNVKVTHAIADALLIAEYARRTAFRIAPQAPEHAP